MKLRNMPLLWVICAPFVLVAGAVLLMLQHTERKVFGVLIDSGGQLLLKMHSQHLASEMGRFLEAPFLAQAYLGHLISVTGLGEKEDLQALQPFMANVLRNTNIAHLSSVNMIQFGSAGGSYFGLERDAGVNAGRILSSQFTDKELRETDSTSGQSRAIAQDYDPRTRPWYEAAAKSRTSVWAPVYGDFVFGKPTLTAVSPVFGTGNQRLLGVAGADLSLAQLQQLLKQTAFHRSFDSSVSFVLDHENRIVVDTSEPIFPVRLGDAAPSMSQSPQPRTPPSALVLAGIAAVSGSAPVHSSLARTDASGAERVQVNGSGSEVFDGSHGLSLVHESQHFMGWITPYTDGRGLDWKLVSLVAQDQLLAEVRSASRSGFIRTITVSILGLLLGLALVVHLLRPIRLTADAAASIVQDKRSLQANLLAQSKSPLNMGRLTSRIREVSLLTNAFNAMVEHVAGQWHELQSAAHRDPLTGLLNQRGLGARARWVSSEPVIVVAVGIHGFLGLTRLFGTDTIDELLVSISRRLKDSSGPQSFVVRGKGAEFIVVRHGSPAADGDALVEAIEGCFARPFKTASDDLLLMPYLGVARGHGDGESVTSTFLRQALIALGVAIDKGAGQRVEYRLGFEEALDRSVSLVGELRTALANREFQLHYQPLVSLSSGKPKGVEALVRWNSPRRGWVPPDGFIAAAESSGFIVELGNWILNKALVDMAEFCAANEVDVDHFVLHVNVSVRQLMHAEFANCVQQTLRRCSFPAKCLVLEVTESLLMRDEDVLLHTIKAIEDIGVKLALDDFGTGYSGLAYLTRFAFESIKLDRSLLLAAQRDHRSAAVMRAAIDMARAVDASSVAEGVETVEQAQFVADMGATVGQGYLFSRPVALADLKKYWSHTKDGNDGVP